MDPASVKDGKVYFEGLLTSPFRIEGIDEYTALQGEIRAVDIEGLWVFPRQFDSGDWPSLAWAGEVYREHLLQLSATAQSSSDYTREELWHPGHNT